MDWAAMVMQMYKTWAQRRGYGVTVVDEMPGEIAGIKVHILSLFILHLSCINIDFYYLIWYRGKLSIYRITHIQQYLGTLRPVEC